MINEYVLKGDVLRGRKTGTFVNGACFVAEPCVTVKYIKSLKPADVAPVVRCKDCKYYKIITPVAGICKRHGLGDRVWKVNDFCSYGIRR